MCSQCIRLSYLSICFTVILLSLEQSHYDCSSVSEVTLNHVGKIDQNIITTKNRTSTAWLIHGLQYILVLYQSNKKPLLTVMYIVKFFIKGEFCDIYRYLNRSHAIQSAGPKIVFLLPSARLNYLTEECRSKLNTSHDLLGIVALAVLTRTIDCQHMGIESMTLFLLRQYFAEEGIVGQWHLFVRPHDCLPIHLIRWVFSVFVCLSIFSP